MTLSRLQIDGFRDHSEAESWKDVRQVRVDLDDVSDATFSVSLLDSPKLQDPGGLDRQQAEDDPRQAAPLSLRFDTGEEVSQQRVGLVYRRAMTLNQNLEALAYYGARRLDSAIPFRFIDLDREFFGAGIKYDRTLELLGLSHRWFIGADLQRQIDDRRNFDNQGGAPGETLLLDQKEEVTSLGVYLQDEIRLSKKWSLVAGGRFDSVNFDIDDHLRADGDDSGTRDFHQTTGRIGVTWLPRPDWQLYTSIAQSFETPTATEVVNRPQGGGGINPDIEPQKAISYEIGLKGLGDGPFTCSLALFHIRLEDELIAFRDPTDRVFYRNAGESRRNGLELGLKRDITEGFEINLAYTYLDAEFDSYEKNGLDLNGNQVPGLPKHQVFGEIVYEHPSGFYAALESLWVGESYADDENTVKSERFVLVNLRTGVTKNFGRWRISPFLGAENLLDESYSSNVRINASGGRYFEPGPGVNLYGGIRIAYLHD
ncbi:MAG: TonB-dependent receptor [Syntrophotaleaceae bacterium]